MVPLLYPATPPTASLLPETATVPVSVKSFNTPLGFRYPNKPVPLTDEDIATLIVEPFPSNMPAKPLPDASGLFVDAFAVTVGKPIAVKLYVDRS